MPTSPAAAKTDLYNLLVTGGVPNIAGVTAVYTYEPVYANLARPCALTMFTHSIGPDFYSITLRIYVDTQVDAQAGQDNLDRVLMAVEQKLSASAEFGRSDWVIGFDADTAMFIASSTIQVDRMDTW